MIIITNTKPVEDEISECSPFSSYATSITSAFKISIYFKYVNSKNYYIEMNECQYNLVGDFQEDIY